MAAAGTVRLMHAVQYDSYGGGAAALKHVEVPVPTPKKGELLVKMEAVSINPVDWKIQTGALRPIFPRKFPHIPASDVAGEVVEVGSGVQNFKVGDKVVATISTRDGGGLAEYAVTKESLTAARPPEVSAADAAALPIAGLTAHEALTRVAGGNTHVTATCGARNIEFVKSLGADEVLDYKTPEGAALHSSSGQKYDAVVHCTSGIPWSTFDPNLSDNGKVIDLTPTPAALLTFALKKLTFSKKQLVPLILSAKAENLDYLVKLVKEGKLKTVIDSKYPLSKAEDAWTRSIEGHATGKIIVEP
nr:putative quinone-oxidoreductase homolog, chloroplastic [Ipomoea batatas]